MYRCFSFTQHRQATPRGCAITPAGAIQHVASTPSTEKNLYTPQSLPTQGLLAQTTTAVSEPVKAAKHGMRKIHMNNSEPARTLP